MGLRWRVSDTEDIKFSGIIAKTAIDLGLVQVPITDHVILNREQVRQIVHAISDGHGYLKLNELDFSKWDALAKWLVLSDKDQITFC